MAILRLLATRASMPCVPSFNRSETGVVFPGRGALPGNSAVARVS